MAKLSPALQAKLDAIRKKREELTQLAEPTGETGVTEPTNLQASGVAPSASVAETLAVPTPVPAPVPHVVKPSLVSYNPDEEYAAFKMKLAELEQQLEESVPGYIYTLRDLHRELAQDANIVTILTPQEISVIVSGLAKNMETTVVVAKKTSKSRTQAINLDEL